MTTTVIIENEIYSKSRVLVMATYPLLKLKNKTKRRMKNNTINLTKSMDKKKSKLYPGALMIIMEIIRVPIIIGRSIVLRRNISLVHLVLR
jgi:hypothetical protein